MLHFIHGAAMAVALIGEVPGVRRVITDHVFLPPISLIAIHPRLVAVQQLTKQLCVMHVRRGVSIEWISLVLLSTPMCSFITKYHC